MVLFLVVSREEGAIFVNNNIVHGYLDNFSERKVAAHSDKPADGVVQAQQDAKRHGTALAQPAEDNVAWGDVASLLFLN
jgi:hypothetical protein